MRGRAAGLWIGVCLCLCASCGDGTDPSTDAGRDDDRDGSAADGGVSTPDAGTSDGGAREGDAAVVPGACGTGRYAAGDVAYLGAFTVPASGEGSFSYGGAAIAFDPTGDDGRGSLVASGHVYDPTAVAEIAIPELIVTDDASALREAAILAPFADITGGLVAGVPNPRMEGMLWTERGTLFNLFMYYNVDNTDVAYLGLSPDAGLWWIGELNMQRTGYLAEIPAPCRTLFGGRRYAVGSVNKAGEATTSPGPHFTAFDLPEPLPAAGSRLPATPALDFDVDHRFSFTVPGADDATLGTTSGPHEWNNSDFAKGMAFVADDTRSSVVYVTVLSTQDPHYAYGDPEDYPRSCSTSRGTHWWGTHAMLLFFDPADLSRAASGEIDPWEPVPYLLHDISDRFFDRSPDRCISIGGVAFDPATQRIFVVEQHWTGSDLVPIVHVLTIG